MKLTKRDHSVIYDCYKNALMSFSQLHRKHFTERAVSTVSNRLSCLCKAGFLSRIRVGITLAVIDPAEVGVVYQVSAKGLRLLRTLYCDEVIRKKPHKLHLANLTHDLLLNETLSVLRNRFPDASLVHGRIIHSGTDGRHPDAVLRHPLGDTAIELELTAKSDSRYRQIIVQYMTDPKYKYVVYIAAGKTIFDKIVYQITNQRRIDGLPPPTTGKFYFVGLRALLKPSNNASISNGSNELFIHP